MVEKLEIFKDPNFKFYPDTHSYVYLGPNDKPIQIFEPVSGFISQFKEPFDSNRIAGYVAKSKGTTREIILEEWAATAKDGTDLGSYIHGWIEDWYNGKEPSLPVFEGIVNPMGTMEERKVDRIQKFLQIHEEKLNIFESIGQEIRLFSREWGIAGTLDILFKLNGKYYVGDWKTNKKFSISTGGKKKMLPPFDDLDACDLIGYSLQISTYRVILEDVAGFVTDGGFLIWLGPEEPKLYKTIDLRDRVRSFLKENNFVL